MSNVLYQYCHGRYKNTSKHPTKDQQFRFGLSLIQAEAVSKFSENLQSGKCKDIEYMGHVNIQLHHLTQFIADI